MIFLIDTCFVTHLQELFNHNIFDFRPILLHNFVGITEPVKEEFAHYSLNDFISLSDLIIIPIKELDFNKAIARYPDIKELDQADQTLLYLGFSQNQTEYVILTDDGELFSECYVSGIPALRLPDFILTLVNQLKIKKNVVAKCLKHWEQQNRYSKQDLKYWSKILQKID